mgnify:CR=1 FL=1
MLNGRSSSNHFEMNRRSQKDGRDGEARGCLVTQAVSALEMLILYDNNVTEFVVRALETLAVDYVFDGPVVQSQVPALRVPALEKAKENERDACLVGGIVCNSCAVEAEQKVFYVANLLTPQIDLLNVNKDRSIVVVRILPAF